MSISPDETPAALPQPAETPARLALEAQGIDRRMLETLVCPVTQGRLSFDPVRGELISQTARLAFPIRGKIPILVASEARTLD